MDSDRRLNPAEPSRWFLGEFPNLSWLWLVMNVDRSGDCVGPLPFLRPIPSVKDISRLDGGS